MRMNQIRIDKSDNNLCSLWLTGQSIKEPFFNILGKAESPGNGKNHSKDRHDGKQRGISKSSRSIDDSSVDKELYSENKPFQTAYSQIMHPCGIIC